MNVLLRLFRTASFFPLAFAGLLSVIFAQTTIIFGAIFYGLMTPGLKKKEPREASSPQRERRAAPAPEATHPDPQTIALLPLVPIVPDSLILLRGEQCYLQEDAQLVISDDQRLHVDGLAGGSTRSRFESKLRRSKRVSATGRVYVTNTRIVFIGTANVHMHIAQILTLDPTPTGVALSFVNEKPMEFITGYGRIALVLRKTIGRLSESNAPSS